MKKYFFTLIELLVVIGIIAILAAMLLPSLNKARATAKKMGCFSNQKQINLLAQMYVSDFGYYSASNWQDSTWTAKYCFVKDNSSGNQNYWPCFIAMYAPNKKMFYDPALGRKLDVNTLCSNTGYGSPKTITFLKDGAIKTPSMKIHLACCSTTSIDAAQAYECRTNYAGYFPGSIDWFIDKGTKLTAVGAANMTDFVNGRHGKYVNVVFADGHAVSYPASEICKIRVKNTPPGYGDGGIDMGNYFRWDKD